MSRGRSRKIVSDDEVRYDEREEAAFLADLRRDAAPLASLQLPESSVPRRIEPVAATSGASSSAAWVAFDQGA
jgi:hypothetical protein